MRGCEKTIGHFLEKARGSLQEDEVVGFATSLLQNKILRAHKQDPLSVYK